MPKVTRSTTAKAASKDVSPIVKAAVKKVQGTSSKSPDVKKTAPVKKAAAPSKGLTVGDKAPADLPVSDDTGKEMPLGDIWKTNGVIIFFYPKANTPGCTTQACGFRDNFESIKKKGYQIYGMSADSVKSQANWKAKHNFQYNLLSDLSKDRSALKALGVNKGASSISRSHIIIGKGGVVEQVAYGVSPKDSVSGASEFVGI
ncbi:hypothetical protein MP228_000338 [Amoeboaphelidium protococcarum]|nr:hypothetical protein MP228_000338 [Amoeboaphelidium protococcarum]